MMITQGSYAPEKATKSGYPKPPPASEWILIFTKLDDATDPKGLTSGKGIGQETRLPPGHAFPASKWRDFARAFGRFFMHKESRSQAEVDQFFMQTPADYQNDKTFEDCDRKRVVKAPLRDLGLVTRSQQRAILIKSALKNMPAHAMLDDDRPAQRNDDPSDQDDDDMLGDETSTQHGSDFGDGDEASPSLTDRSKSSSTKERNKKSKMTAGKAANKKQITTIETIEDSEPGSEAGSDDDDEEAKEVSANEAEEEAGGDLSDKEAEEEEEEEEQQKSTKAKKQVKKVKKTAQKKPEQVTGKKTYAAVAASGPVGLDRRVVEQVCSLIILSKQVKRPAGQTGKETTKKKQTITSAPKQKLTNNPQQSKKKN